MFRLVSHVRGSARLKGRLHVSVSTSAFSSPPHHSVAPDATVFRHGCGPKRAEPKWSALQTCAAVPFSAELSVLNGFAAACGATQPAALADGFLSRLPPPLLVSGDTQHI